MKDKPKELPPDVPAWILTYSNVITLLMTFFILLLTFSTNEPEHFERMQVSMFGTAGSSGFAGPVDIAKESIMSRVRPPAARMTVRGAEMPPINQDPGAEAMKAGLNGLEDSKMAHSSRQHVFQMSTNLLVDEEENLSAMGIQILRMFGRQLAAFPYELNVQLDRADDIPTAIKFAQFLINHQKLAPGRIGISLAKSPNEKGRLTRFMLTRPGQE